MDADWPVPAEWELERLEPALIQRRIGLLIRCYARRRSPTVARLVVRYLDGLCAHPRWRCGADERCDFRRLARRWRLLAELG